MKNLENLFWAIFHLLKGNKEVAEGYFCGFLINIMENK